MRDYRFIRGPLGGAEMLDGIFVATGFGLFFIGILYVFACDRL
jgi:hypothetical protein